MCRPVRYGSELCVVIAGGSHCKTAYPGERSGFSVGAETLDVFVQKIYEGSEIDMSVVWRKQTYNLTKVELNKVIVLGPGVTIEHMKVDAVGGNCRTA